MLRFAHSCSTAKPPPTFQVPAAHAQPRPLKRQRRKGPPQPAAAPATATAHAAVGAAVGAACAATATATSVATGPARTPAAAAATPADAKAAMAARVQTQGELSGEVLGFLRAQCGLAQEAAAALARALDEQHGTGLASYPEDTPNIAAVRIL